MSTTTHNPDDNTKATEKDARAANKDAQFASSDVVIGALIGLDAQSQALVAYPGSPSKLGLRARSTVSLVADDIGREVALLFENGDPQRPLIIGRIHHTHDLGKPTQVNNVSGSADGERLEFKAGQEIVLKCGKASITLTKAGKILIRGTYLLSRSSGANRIKGGSIQLN